jgi:peptidoglycan/LPS O-acetylase OafA/YrhL
MTAWSMLVLNIVLGLVAAYVLYFVVRRAVRDGIEDAEVRRRSRDGDPSRTSSGLGDG